MSKTPKTTMTEEQFASLISDIWKEVHDGIGPLREETFKLLPLLNKNENSDESKEKSNLEKYYKFVQVPLANDTEARLSEFAHEAYNCARDFQEETQKLSGKKTDDVLRITTRAGVLLYYTEQILMRYNGLKERANASNTPLPINFGIAVLSEAMTAITTARDHMIAADGFVKNLKEQVGKKERWQLLGVVLFPSIFLYLLFNPSTFHIPLIPPTFQSYWEIVFWSLFGAVSISFITMSEDMNNEVFDPRHLHKYEYRIAVSPFVAVLLVLFFSLVGFESGNISLKLDLATPSYPVIVILSFLFGFFGKRSLDLLDTVWQRIFPSTRPEKKQKTPKATKAPPAETEASSTPQTEPKPAPQTPSKSK